MPGSLLYLQQLIQHILEVKNNCLYYMKNQDVNLALVKNFIIFLEGVILFRVSSI